MIDRLKKILHYYNISPSIFADKMDIQRSSISHIFSGRNKPSLDFILKLQDNFPDINLYWFLNGNGEMLTNSKNKNTNLFDVEKEQISKNELKESVKFTETLLPQIPISKTEKSIQKIIVFYMDKTFDIYNPS